MAQMMVYPEHQEVYGMNERIKKLNYLHRTTPKTLDLTLAKVITEVYQQTEMLAPIMRRAMSTAKVAELLPVYLEEGQLFIGGHTAAYKAAALNPMLSCMWVTGSGGPISLNDRDAERIEVTEEQQKVWMEEISPYWMNRTVLMKTLANIPPEIAKRTIGSGYIEGSFMLGLWGSHNHPDFTKLVTTGLNYIRDYAKNWLATQYDPMNPELNDKANFYKAVIVEMDGLELYAHRCSDYALELAAKETDPKRKAELELIGDTCKRIPMEAPRTFYECLQLCWFVEMFHYWEGSGGTLGRMDQYLWPFYERELAAGTLTREQAKEYLECLYHKMTALSTVSDPTSARYLQGEANFMQIQVGGYDVKGNDATNDLSILILEALTDTHTVQPHMTCRLNPKSPEDYRMAIIDLIASGTGQPSIYNDVVSGQILLKRGHTQAEAYDYDSFGCMEVGKRANYWWGPGVWMNGDMYVEMAFTQGKKRADVFGACLGEQLSVETPDPRTFKTFEEFEDAVKAHTMFAIQNVYAMDRTVIENYKYYPVVLSSVDQHAGLERGLPFHEGGCYSSCVPGFDFMGIPDVADSLAVVKKLVFDDKSITMDQLCKALDANFEGYEDIRQMCLDVPKYGNDDDYVDSIGQEFLDWLCDYIKSLEGLMAKYDPDQATAKQRHTVGLAWAPLSASVEFGRQVGALPSGRLKGEPMGDSCAPYMGMDVNGPTAALRSVAKMPHNKTDGTITNLYLTKNLLSTMEGRKAVSDMIQTYFDEGGAHIQISCTSIETLKKAQEHPEQYKNLLVRVAGYSAYFVDLSKDVQDSIMMRTVHDQL